MGKTVMTAVQLRAMSQDILATIDRICSKINSGGNANGRKAETRIRGGNGDGGIRDGGDDGTNQKRSEHNGNLCFEVNG